MNLDILFAIVFYGLLILLFYKQKKNVQVQGKIIALYRTKVGLKLMDKIAKSYPRFLKVLGVIGVITGFVGMAFIFYFLLKGTFDLFFVPSAPPAVAPVLPGIKVLPGLPVLSFWHWIIAIFFVAVVHEFAHGIYARLYNNKVKSSGIALFGPILGAFVEPDEKQLNKKSTTTQLSVFAAGPFSNILFGLLFLLLFNTISGPVYAAIFMGDGIVVNELVEDYPAADLDVELPFTIKGINNQETLNITTFLDKTKDIRPGDTVTLNTDKGDLTLTTTENPDNKSKAFMGIAGLEIKKVVKQDITTRFGTFLPSAFTWIHMLIFWLIIVNIGVGLFNLLPLGPIDGGRMFLTASLVFFKEEKAKHIWALVTYFCLLLIFINLSPYLWKLVVWLFKPLIIIFGV
jgi:membrane-associated protease RseP (regulator of RpoE activity)